MNTDNFVANVDFMENHIGGNLNDKQQTFINQKNIIENSTSDYNRLLNFYNRIERDKNKNNNQTERQDNELHTTVYRINNTPTTIDDINYSNPIIYPKEYDEYFEYLFNKNLISINNRVVKKKKYINIDSDNRNKKPSVNIEKYINLADNSLLFTNSLNTFRINLENAKKYFNPNDYIILRGFKNYSVNYKNMNFYFTNNSKTVVIDLIPNFDKTIPYYDIIIEISGVKYNNSSTFKNIPLSVINSRHLVSVRTIFFPALIQKLSFEINIPYYTTDVDNILTSDCNISFYNIGNYPINLINASTPTTDTNLYPYLIVQDVFDNYINIRLNDVISINVNIILNGIWNNNVFFTGTNIQIGKVVDIIEGYKYPNSYTIPLNENYNNICSIKMISSEIPNPQLNIITPSTFIEQLNVEGVNIQIVNDKLYWENIIDNGIYSLSLEQGFYSYPELKYAIETKASLIIRNPIISDNNLVPQNILNVSFDTISNISTFNLYNLYNLPECFVDFITINSTSYSIKINHPNHNQSIGDTIFITASLDYYLIPSYIINQQGGHIITSIINNDYYIITISGINFLSVSTGDTKGGYEIQIKTFAIFRLYFNTNDTFGNLIGFTNTGNKYSITSYGKIITNKMSYYIDVNKIYIINNTYSQSNFNNFFRSDTFRYILLQAEGLNQHTNPNNVPFFYKFLLSGQPNTYLYNTFVNTPIYFNPPIKTIKELKFKFLTPYGTILNFNDLNHSFTLEITCFDNSPENTNINTFTSRI